MYPEIVIFVHFKVIHLTGPISGLLQLKFTIRTIYATGCFFATLGIGLCYFATDIGDISLYIGVVQGKIY